MTSKACMPLAVSKSAFPEPPRIEGDELHLVFDLDSLLLVEHLIEQTRKQLEAFIAEKKGQSA